MEYRQIGNSSLKLSEITFGAWAAGGWMWGGSDKKDAIDAIRVSYDLGVTSIDTAPIYGQGRSEEIVGEAIKSIPRDKIQVLTKFGMRWDLKKGDFAFRSKDNDDNDIDIYKYAGKESIIKECEDSLRRLGTDYIDLYQIHWPETTTAIDESMAAVNRLIEQGKVLHAGVCNYNEAQLEESLRTTKLVSDQVPFSMVKQDINEHVVPFCRSNQLSILAYSPLERGLLTGKMKPGYQFSEGDHRANLFHFKDENLARVNSFLKKLEPLANQRRASISQLVLRWTLEQPGITIALAGARDVKQATQNAGTSAIKLSSEELNFISAELLQLELIK